MEFLRLRRRTIRRTSHIPAPRRNNRNQVAHRNYNPGIMPDTQQNTFRTNVHMPVFKPSDIISWFRRLEHWFNLQKIDTEQARFSLIASQLDDPALSHLPEWNETPAENPYSTVKAKIIAIFEESTQTKIQKLMEKKPLGDLKPSLLLAEMKNIGVGLTDDVLRNLWIKRLPEAAQTVLAVTTDIALDQAAKAADSIMESINSAKTVSQITTESKQISELNAKIDALTKSLSEMQTSNQRSRSLSKKRAYSSNPNDDTVICRFHRKFGDDARRCLLPCSYKSKPKN